MMDASVAAGSSIESAYRALTPGSARAIDRARRFIPSGSTRSFTYFRPYPIVFTGGEGSILWDVDDNPYIDFLANGLSLIHGNAYPPILEAATAALNRGTAWPGTSDAQIAFAEVLVDRFEPIEQVRFANTGTEATMLSLKLARQFTGRPLILKAWHGYHGSSEELSAGLGGKGEIPGQMLLARFGDENSFSEKLEQHAKQVAAVILEPVPYTGRVTPPPDGFLEAVEGLAHRAGALSIIDDCLMSRLAVGGSSERFSLQPDIVCLGKWIGGGFPVGAIGASRELMRVFDHDSPDFVEHGGSFNGNPVGMEAGRVAVEHLTAERIEEMERHTAVLVDGIKERAAAHGVPVSVQGVGSCFGLYALDASGEPCAELTSLLQLAAVSNGVYCGPGGEFAVSTSMTDELIARALEGLDQAFGDLAREAEKEEG